MKKGLLSLLALALTVVGCQNYDDQFDELTALVEALTEDVEALPDYSQAIEQIRSQVATILTTVGQNATAIGQNGAAIGQNATAIGQNATAIQNVSDDVIAELGTISATLAGLEEDIANAATAADLATISNTIGDVQADVRELLEQNAVINVDITINNTATLEFAESLIAQDGPNVTINGQVVIDTGVFGADGLARVDAVAAKIYSILGDGASTATKVGLRVTSDEPVTFTNLVFIDDDYEINGSDQDDDALLTISGDLDIDYGDVDDAIDFGNLTSVTDINISTETASQTTAVNFAGVNAEDLTVNSAATLAFKNAATINLGGLEFTDLDADVADTVIADANELTANTTVDAPEATTVTLGGLTDISTFNLTINAADAETVTIGGSADLEAGTGDITVVAGDADDIDISALTDTDGEISITASSVTEVDLSGLETADDAITVTAQKVAKVDLSSLEATGAAISIDATEIDFTALETIGHATDLNTVAVLTTPALTSVTAGLTVDNGPLNFPNASVRGAGDIISANATHTTVASSDDANLDNVVSAATTHLVVNSQGINTVLDATTAAVVALTIHASGTAATNDLTVNAASSAALTELHVNGFDVTTVTAAAALVTMTTAGTMRNLDVDDCDALVSLDIDHTYSSEYTDAQLVHITGNLVLEAVDLSSVHRLENADITSNAALATITAPATTDLLTPGATTNLVVTGNSLTATWTDAVAAISNGITNTLYEQSEIYQPSLITWKTYIDAIEASTGGSITFSLDFDSEGGAASNFATRLGTDSDHTATPAWAGTIDTEAELNAVKE